MASFVLSQIVICFLVVPATWVSSLTPARLFSVSGKDEIDWIALSIVFSFNTLLPLIVISLLFLALVFKDSRLSISVLNSPTVIFFHEVYTPLAALNCLTTSSISLPLVASDCFILSTNSSRLIIVLRLRISVEIKIASINFTKSVS